MSPKSKYNLFPDLTTVEYEALKASIADRGVDISIIVDDDGTIIDGWHRQKACDELGIFCPREVRRFASEEEKLELAVTANAKRRQLDRDGKRALVATYLKIDPTINDNWLAEMIGGMAKMTVTKVRVRLEATLKIPKLDAFRGKDGRTRPRKYNRIVVNTPKELNKALEAIMHLPENGKMMDATTAARRARRNDKKAEREGKSIIPLADDSIRIYHCPFQELEAVAKIAPASVNFFYADIPYDGGFVEQVDALAAIAARVLVEGGVCAVMAGQYYLDRVMGMLGKHLTWRWAMASVWEGAAPPIHQLHVVNNWKPILIFSKGEWTVTGRWPDVSRLTTQEKEWHPWQQPLEEVESLVRTFSNPGNLVLDPCGGGFTTAVACKRLGRRCVSCDVDLQAVLAGQVRLRTK